MYGVPASARASVLTQKLNLHAADGTYGVAGHRAEPLPPRGPGRRPLTDDERKTIAVYPMDLGGQYYARQNTGFVPFTNGDPSPRCLRIDKDERSTAMRNLKCQSRLGFLSADLVAVRCASRGRLRGAASLRCTARSAPTKRSSSPAVTAS